MKLGSLITDSGERDAIHIAIAPITASEIIFPGQHVDAKGTVRGKFVGIIDPFLKDKVMPGEKCYICLYPETVTSLRHEWCHPEFQVRLESSLIKESSIDWLTDFAQKLDITYDQLIEHLKLYLGKKDYLILNQTIPDFCYDDRELMWIHYEIVTGIKVKNKDDVPFSCSC